MRRRGNSSGQPAGAAEPAICRVSVSQRVAAPPCEYEAVHRRTLQEEAYQVGYGVGHALHEVRLLLEVASEAVGAEHLQREYERYKPFTGLDAPVIEFLENDGEVTEFLEFLKGVDILGQKLVAQAFRQVGLGLP